MSGFRDYNLPVIGEKTKTLASAWDEDDWDDIPPEVQESPKEVEKPSSQAYVPLAPAKPFQSSAPSAPVTPVASFTPAPAKPVKPFRPEQTVPYVNPTPQSFTPIQVQSVPVQDRLKNFQQPPIAPAAVAVPKPIVPQVKPTTFVPTSSTVSPVAQVKPSIPSNANPFKSTLNSPINSQDLSTKFPIYTISEIEALYHQFALLDTENTLKIHQNDLSSLSTKAGLSSTLLTSKILALKLVDSHGLVTFDDFLKAAYVAYQESNSSIGQKDSKKIVLHGHMENTTHTINVDEKESFTVHINQTLGSDLNLSGRLPVDPKSMQIFTECKDGILLAKLINDAVPNTIDERVLNMGKKLNTFQITENINLVVNSAKAIGCHVVNIGAADIKEGREHLILGLIWQIIKIGLQSYIDIKHHPELFRLLNPGEDLEAFLKLPAEQILLRWVNYHLKKANYAKTVNNFTSDVKDGEAYTYLLHQLSPSNCSKAPLNIHDLMQRAEEILINAEKLGCRKYLTAKTLVEGNQKLNFAFVANLFNTIPGLEKLSESEMAGLDSALFDSQGDREARAFALWMNSLGVDPFINNLFDDLNTGLILLQTIEKVNPGSVDWKHINIAPSTVFKKVENCNYVINLCKALKFSLVGIQGSDIVDGNKKLTLALVWQLMRSDVVKTLKSLSKSGVDISDSDIIDWANNTIRAHKKKSFITTFKDSSLKSSLFLLDLLDSIKPGVVNYDLVSHSSEGRGLFNVEGDLKLNAQYAISIARKLGATIFVLPEDIVEVQPKMILTFVGSLMAVSRNFQY